MKKYVIAFFIILIVLGLTPVSFALEHPPFGDIENSQYKDSIIFLYEKGIVTGYQDNNFYPDKEITIHEFCCMVTKAFYPSEYIYRSEATPWYTPYVDTLLKKKVLTSYDYYNWECGYFSAISFLDRAMIAAKYYNRPLDINSYILRVQKTAIDSDLVSKDYDWNKNLTRGEMAEIIAKLLTNNFKKFDYATDISVNYFLDNFQNMDETFRENECALENIPDKYIDLFNNLGYILVITKNCQDYYPEKSHTVGITDVTNKIVFVEQFAQGFTLYHEFAHVISFEIFPNKDDILNFIYDNEAESISKFTSTYALASPDECFAEAFCWFITNKNNEKLINIFRNANPIATKIILDNMINYEGLANLEEINKIIPSIPEGIIFIFPRLYKIFFV